MMRLPPFRYVAPRSIAEAVDLLAASPETTMLLAGGTDLLPNMKRRQQTPATVIGLRHITALGKLSGGREPEVGGREPDAFTIGAGVTLARIVDDAALRATAPGLWQAAAQVATPHLRNMGTIGGNLCLDTRCTYYDQNYEWRKAIDFCMKKDGHTCWVATSSPKCLAVSSTDTAPILQALGAHVRLASPRGTRVVSLEDFYANDGMRYLTKRADEILTAIDLPDLDGVRSTYWKLRRRGSIDFPVASVAAVARIDADGRVRDARIVLGAVASRPMASPKAAALLDGEVLTDDRIAAAADAAYEVAKPMDNTDFALVWRKRMVKALVGYALREVRGDDMSSVRRRIARQDLTPLTG